MYRYCLRPQYVLSEWVNRWQGTAANTVNGLQLDPVFDNSRLRGTTVQASGMCLV